MAKTSEFVLAIPSLARLSSAGGGPPTGRSRRVGVTRPPLWSLELLSPCRRPELKLDQGAKLTAQSASSLDRAMEVRVAALERVAEDHGLGSAKLARSNGSHERRIGKLHGRACGGRPNARSRPRLVVPSLALTTKIKSPTVSTGWHAQVSITFHISICYLDLIKTCPASN